jgi:hypothetical protein
MKTTGQEAQDITNVQQWAAPVLTSSEIVTQCGQMLVESDKSKCSHKAAICELSEVNNENVQHLNQSVCILEPFTNIPVAKSLRNFRKFDDNDIGLAMSIFSFMYPLIDGLEHPGMGLYNSG